MSALPFELIALDLDGTLPIPTSRISPRNLAAVRACRQRGAKAIIGSGRMHCTTTAYWREMALDTPIISYNGALVKHEGTGEVLLDRHVEPSLARELVELCAREELHLNYYHGDTLYIARQNRWSDLYATRTSAVPQPVGDLRRFADQPPTKLLIVAEPERIARLYAEWGPRYGSRAYITPSFDDYLEFLPLGADNGTALAFVAEHFGIAREKVIAFGDALNDLPALRWAGMGVAMGNARPDVQAAANRVAPPHDADGVARVLEELFSL